MGGAGSGAGNGPDDFQQTVVQGGLGRFHYKARLRERLVRNFPGKYRPRPFGATSGMPTTPVKVRCSLVGRVTVSGVVSSVMCFQIEGKMGINDVGAGD